jgi:tetratricopeptide (TPR) repeat protein
MMKRFRLLFAVAAIGAAGCAHAQQTEAVPSLQCGAPHTRPQATAMVAACDRELESASATEDRVRLLYGRGVALTNTRDLGEAITTLDQVIALDPAHARAYRLRGYVYWRQRNLDQAAADTEAALRIDPNMAMAYYSRALIYSMREEGLAGAIPEAARAHQIEPQNPVFLTTLCRLRHAAGGDLDVALADCNRALELRPAHADTHEYRGRVHLTAGRTAEALADFEMALSLDPELASARYGRGLARVASGQTADGSADMEAARAMDAEVANLFVTPRRTY